MAPPQFLILVTQFAPLSVGHGGNHRSYQILHDMERIVGAENVVLITRPAWGESAAAQSQQHTSILQRVASAMRRIGLRIPPLRWAARLCLETDSLVWRRPAELLVGQNSRPVSHATPDFLDHYRKRISELRGAAVCIIEHPGFSRVLPINQQFHIPTIACSQNIEAFDVAAPLQPEQRRQMHLAALNFADEFQVLARCDARLFISKVETGLVGGLGAPSRYYPYMPVGEIRHAMETIRAKRVQAKIEPGLFLMVGTAAHNTTRQAFGGFLRQAMTQGLPKGVRIVICGYGTESLLPGVTDPGLELRGWVEQLELDELLCSVQGVLVPQTIGFGALTRLPELALAGVPVITSQHSLYAIDLPPGITVVDDTWQGWGSAMLDLMHADKPLDAAAYDIWESNQVNTLNLVVKQLLTVSRDMRQTPVQIDEIHALSNIS